jgi:hypothetical protein
MNRFALIAALTILTSPTFAQEGPAPFVGCYGELGVSGQSTTIDKETTRTLKQLGGGAGCNKSAGNLIVGGGLRLDTGSGGRTSSVVGKVGVPINDGLMAYGLMDYSMDASKRIDVKNGVLSAGIGAEVALSKDVKGYAELTRDIARTGGARAIDDQYTVRAGVRIYLGK